MWMVINNLLTPAIYAEKHRIIKAEDSFEQFEVSDLKA